MKPEYLIKFREELRKEDLAFRDVILADVTFMHQLFAKYHDTKWLEIAKDLGAYQTKLKNRTYLTPTL